MPVDMVFFGAHPDDGEELHLGREHRNPLANAHARQRARARSAISDSSEDSQIGRTVRVLRLGGTEDEAWHGPTARICVTG